jgi:Protein of unknown function (DUF3570)
MCARARVARPACKGVGVAAISATGRFWRRLIGLFGKLLGGLVGGVLAIGSARAVDLPPDSAELLYHAYSGGGTKAYGPALLVRKSVLDKVSLSGSYYVDAVSNASIDVITTASPYSERRSEYSLGLDYVYRDSQITVSGTTSREPDYTANTFSADISQEVFGGMSTVSLGFSRGSDTVLKKGAPEFADAATHWQYRLGVTQILTKRWLMSANVEALADSGFLGSPYRSARAFGAAVRENDPRTRSARAIKFRVIGDLGSRDSVHADYRYFRDTWDIKAHTAELGYSRYFGDPWLADAFVRYYTQQHALFYSDNAQSDSTFVSRNRQLSTFNTVGLGAKLAWTARKVPGQYEVKVNGAYEYVRFKFKDFTDQSGSPYSYNTSVLQLFVSATF